nr:response regulator transcription factor [Pseudoxanthomonas gei]
MLVVEDNASLVANLFDYFEARGHTLDAAPDGITGLHLATHHAYDIVLLDWMLPRMDGREVLRRLRLHHPTQPVIILSARDELPDKIAGFRAGADDYLTKPFALPELEVRLEALLARSGERGRSRVLEIHGLRLDLRTLEAYREGRVLHLYPACRKLLEILMQASPAAVSRERLEVALWGEEPPDGNLLRSHIYELRRSIDGPFAVKLLHTLPRMGYRLGIYAPPDPARAEEAVDPGQLAG